MFDMRLTIGKKLTALAAIALVSLLVLLLASLRNVDSLQQATLEVGRTAQAVRNHMEADMMHDALRADVLAALLAAKDGDLEQRGAVLGDLDEHAAHFSEMVRANQALLEDPTLLNAVNKVAPALNAYIQSAGEIATLAFEQPEAAGYYMPQFNESFDNLADAMERVSDLMTDSAVSSAAASESIVSQARFSSITIFAVTAALLAYSALLIGRNIVKPIRQVVSVTREIAGGQLDVDIDIQSTDETADMLQALTDMRDRVREVITRVREAGDVVASSSREIAQSSMNLSQRIEETAATIEETRSTMQEISSTVAGNADLAGKAGGFANSASERTAASLEVVSRTSGAMEQANHASSRIGEIIGTIDGIAFQTNLLALNAAVEAARAGELGRGFAVVASEVRSLAQRSAEAAQEIKNLISDNVDKVRQGSELAQESAARLGDTDHAINELTAIVKDVARASSDQAHSIGQVDTAVGQMDAVTQQNAALVEELAAASNTMEQQASELMRLVAFFKTAESVRYQTHGRPMIGQLVD